MYRTLIQCLLLAAASAMLAACGGGGGGSTSVASDSPTPAPHEYVPAVFAPSNPDNPGDNLTPTEKDQILTVVGSDADSTITPSQLTVSLCPNALLGDTGLSQGVSQLTCNNEALHNISLGNDDVLGLLCHNTVTATSTGLIKGITNPDFIKQCGTEAAGYLKDTLTGLVTDPAHSIVTSSLCPDADNAGTCVVDFLKSAPGTLKDTLGGLAGFAGCSDISDPTACLASLGQSLASGQLLINTGQLVGTAICPLASRADKFDPKACLTEAASAIPSVLALADAGQALSGLSTTFEQVPVLGDIFKKLLGAASNSGLPLDPADLANQLQTLAVALTSGDVSGLSAQGQAVVGQIPVLGPVIGQLLGTVVDAAGQCDPSDPASCAAALEGAAGQLQQLTSLLNQVPVLGGVINGILGQLPIPGIGGDSGGLPSDPLAALQGALTQVPVLGGVLNGILDQLPIPGAGGGSGTGGLPGADQLAKIPVLGNLLNTLLGGLTSGQMPSLAQLPQMLQQVPVLGDVVGQLTGALGNGTLDPSQLKNIAGALSIGDFSALTGPVQDVLNQIPVLGPIVGGLLDTIANTASQCDPSDPASCAQALEGAAGQLQQLTGLLNQVPVLGGILNGIIGQLPIPGVGGGNGASLPGGNPLAMLQDGLANIPVLGDVLNQVLGGLTGAAGGGLPTDALNNIPVVGDLLNQLLGGLTGAAGNGLDPSQLMGLAQLTQLLQQIPVLGDIVAPLLANVPGLGGGQAGGLPLDPSQLSNIASALSSGDLSALTDPLKSVLTQIPALGPILGQVLDGVAGAASQCDPTDPSSCMAALGDAGSQLGQVTGLLNNIPVLGGILNGILGQLPIPGIGGGNGAGLPAGNPLAMLQDGLAKIPVLGDLINQGLSQLQGAAGGGLPTDALGNIPVLGDLLNSLLGGLTNGDALSGAGGIQNLFGNLVSGNGSSLALVPKVVDLVSQIPALGDPLASVLEKVVGNDDALLNQLLSPIAGALNQVPVLGPVLGKLLGTLGLA